MDVVKVLIEEHKMSADDKDDEGWTSLHWTAYRGHTDLFRWCVALVLCDMSFLLSPLIQTNTTGL